MTTVDPLQRLQALIASLGRISGVTGDAAGLMRRVVEETMQFTGATGAVVEQACGEELVYVCAAGSVAAHAGLRIPVGKSLSGLCVRQGKVMHCEDSETDPRVNLEACRAVGARSMLIVPLSFDGRVVGVLKALSAEPAAFSALDEQALHFSAAIIGATLGRELRLEEERRRQDQLREDLVRTLESERGYREAALTDTLTGLPNRRRFETWIDERCARSVGPIGRDVLCFIDLDRFKAINDELGHEAGDTALRCLADCLRQSVRDEDRIARLAGDEFVVLLVDRQNPASEAEWFVRRLLKRIQEHPLNPLHSRYRLSPSIGIAVREDDTLDRSNWLSRADHAMYRAKSSKQCAWAIWDAQSGDEAVRADRR